MKNRYRKIAADVLKAEADAIEALIKKLDDNFEKAVDVIYNSKGRTVVTGMGKSGLIGKKIAATLSSTGTPTFFLHPAEAGHGDLGMITSNDIIIALSNSGETDEILKLIPSIKMFKVTLISMTSPSSSLAGFSDIVLDVSVKHEACPMGVVPTSSTTATLAMGDALAVALIERRGFKEEDFAVYHPNGSLGKKLLFRVSDLMHKGMNIPTVKMDTPMTDTAIEMSSKRLGMTIVMSGSGEISGIITDGDLRRGIEKWGGKLFEMKAGEVQIKDPRMIPQDTLATRALAIMEDHSITSLIISDDNKSPLGVVHLHDILRKGIS
ncbi:MAG: KpsF/GutQ family sugar-phosphate isomerase [Nitrospirota bacterium]|nr:MAG: KpsF/GutQ family sugar-phosphate isomerase [Nitrospirota bacterium]